MFLWLICYIFPWLLITCFAIFLYEWSKIIRDVNELFSDLITIIAFFSRSMTKKKTKTKERKKKKERKGKEGKRKKNLPWSEENSVLCISRVWHTTELVLQNKFSYPCGKLLDFSVILVQTSSSCRYFPLLFSWSDLALIVLFYFHYQALIKQSKKIKNVWKV